MSQKPCWTFALLGWAELWDFISNRVRPERGFKNRKRKPDFPRNDSGSYYRNRNNFFAIRFRSFRKRIFKKHFRFRHDRKLRFYRKSGRILNIIVLVQSRKYLINHTELTAIIKNRAAITLENEKVVTCVAVGNKISL